MKSYIGLYLLPLPPRGSIFQLPPNISYDVVPLGLDTSVCTPPATLAPDLQYVTVCYKLCSLMYRLDRNVAPSYLSELCAFCTDSQSPLINRSGKLRDSQNT